MLPQPPAGYHAAAADSVGFLAGSPLEMTTLNQCRTDDLGSAALPDLLASNRPYSALGASSRRKRVAWGSLAVTAVVLACAELAG